MSTSNSYSVTPGASACPKCGAVYAGVRDVCSRCGAQIRGSQNEIPTGTIIDNKYEIVGLLGVGGMGEVYKASHLHLNAFRCIKVMKRNLLDDQAFRNRFLREARLATQIQHPNVAILHDFSTLADGSYYMVWEYIDGITVRQWATEHGRFPIDLAIDVALQVLAGLDHIHRRGLLHRDMSGDNIMITRSGDDLHVKIIDLGIAKQLSAPVGEATQVGLFVGNPKYSSPEQLGDLHEGEEIDERSDLYSFGVVLYEMLMGVPLFQSRTPHGYISKHLMQPPTPFRDVDPALEGLGDLQSILFKALEKDRKRRYANAKEFARALREYLPTEDPLSGTRARRRTAPGAAQRNAATVVTPQPVSTGDQRDWEIAASLDTVEAYEYFLQTYPEAPRAAQARTRRDGLLLERVHQLESQWQTDQLNEIVSARGVDDVVGREAHAATRRVESARQQAAEAAEAEEWSRTEAIGSAAAWREFVEAHETSGRREEAEARWAEAEAYEQATGAATAAAFNSFLQQWPDGPHASAAAQQLQAAAAVEFRSRFVAARTALNRAALAEIAREAPMPIAEEARQLVEEIDAFEVARSGSTVESWETFLGRFPAGLLSARARRQVEAARAERESLDAALEERSSQAIARFVAAHPQSPLRPQALLLQAESEAFERAEQAGSAEGWAAFLEEHGQGRFEAEAREHHSRLLRSSLPIGRTADYITRVDQPLPQEHVPQQQAPPSVGTAGRDAATVVSAIPLRQAKAKDEASKPATPDSSGRAAVKPAPPPVAAPPAPTDSRAPKPVPEKKTATAERSTPAVIGIDRTPQVSPAPPSSRKYMFVAAAALLLLVAIVGVYKVVDRSPAVTEPAGDVVAQPDAAPVSQPGPGTTETPVGSGQVIVNALPWGEVRSVVDSAGTSHLAAPVFTPAVLNLPPGAYKVTVSNARSGRTETIDVIVSPTQVNSYTKSLDTVDAERYLASVGVK